MIRKYIIEADDSIKGFDEEITRLEREWGAEELEPCDDCISRQAVLDKATSWDAHFADSERAVSLTDIMSLPPVTPARPKGKWIERTFPSMIYDFKCSECGETIEAVAKSNYCPHCGADMRGDSE